MKKFQWLALPGRVVLIAIFLFMFLMFISFGGSAWLSTGILLVAALIGFGVGVVLGEISRRIT